MCFPQSNRVVTENCYPYQPPQQAPAEVGRCMMQSRAVGRGKRQATQRCPNTYNYHNDIYQSTPPYRLSSNVSTPPQKKKKTTRKPPACMHRHEARRTSQTFPDRNSCFHSSARQSSIKTVLNRAPLSLPVTMTLLQHTYTHLLFFLHRFTNFLLKKDEEPALVYSRAREAFHPLQLPVSLMLS